MSDERCYDRLVAGLQYLNSVCDGAHALDGHGFNGNDSNFGKSLARQTLERNLSRKQALIGCKMIQKYRKQCDRVNIALPTYAELEAELNGSNTDVDTEGQIELLETDSGDRIAVSFKFNPERVNLVKTLGPSEKVNGQWIPLWNKDTKQWLFPLDREYLEKTTIAFPSFLVDARIDAKIRSAEEEAEIDREIREAELKAKRANLGDLMSVRGPGKISLFKHQQDGASWLIERDRAILADEMGLGKTYTALIAASAYKLPIFVVCPASLQTNWKREAARLGIHIATSSWAKIPEPLEFSEYVVIADEAHYAQNIRAKRTQQFIAFALQAKAAFLLTGTPLKNGRPSNLFPLLVAIKHPLGDNKRYFEKRYCAAHYERYRVKGQDGITRYRQVWDNTGAAHLDELFQKTTSAMLRRTKAQCLDLPGKIRTYRPVLLDKAQMDEYIEMFDEMRAEYHDRLQKGEIMKGAEALVLLNHLRHSGSIAKAPIAVELAEELADDNKPCVIFTAFKESAAIIARELDKKKISNWTLSGNTPTKDRQGLIDDFQNGDVDVAICLFGAGGVGITLTAASHVILVDRPWTPGDAMQAEDRLHRIGAEGNVTAIWLQLDGIPYESADSEGDETIDVDSWIDTILLQKQQRIDLVLEGKRKTMRGIAGIEAMAIEVLHNIMEGGSKKDYEDLNHEPDITQPIK